MSALTEQYPGFARRLALRLIASGYARHVGRRTYPDTTRFAAAMQVTRKMAYLWVHGRAFPKHHLERICALLEVQPDALLYSGPPANIESVLGRLAPDITTPLLASVPLSTAYPEVDAMVAYIRGELTQIWEQGDAEQREDLMAHFARQVHLIRKHMRRRDAT